MGNATMGKDVHSIIKGRGFHQGVHLRKEKERFRVRIGFEGIALKVRNINSIMIPRQRPRKAHLLRQTQVKISPNRNLFQNRNPREDQVHRQ